MECDTRALARLPIPIAIFLGEKDEVLEHPHSELAQATAQIHILLWRLTTALHVAIRIDLQSPTREQLDGSMEGLLIFAIV
jgi:hypothetical protein